MFRRHGLSKGARGDVVGVVFRSARAAEDAHFLHAAETVEHAVGAANFLHRILNQFNLRDVATVRQ